MQGLWHKNTIVYTVDLQSFADGNGGRRGIGNSESIRRAPRQRVLAL